MILTTESLMGRYPDLRPHWEAARSCADDGDMVGSARHYMVMVESDPDCLPALAALAALSVEAGDLEWTRDTLERIVAVEPRLMESWHNLGTTTKALGDLSRAESCFRQAMALAPILIAPRFGLADCLMGTGKRDAAHAVYRGALGLPRAGLEDVWLTAHYLIAAGHWDAGWMAYESRHGMAGWRTANEVSITGDQPDLWVDQDLSGRHLVVVGEQGHGDTLMCLRYAPILVTKAARVTWAVKPELVELVTALIGGTVVGTDQPFPVADYAVDAMSLHQRLGVSRETVPATHRGIPRQPGTGIGLCWQGNPRHRHDRLRSIDPEYLAGVMAHPAVVGLQRGSDLIPDQTGSWMETAEGVAGLAMVVTVDTAIAHLAGCLGVPTAMLVAAIPDCRWGFQGVTTPWYPSLRLYRQPRIGDWDSPIAALMADIADGDLRGYEEG